MTGTIDLYTYNLLASGGGLSVTGSPDSGFPEARIYDRCIDLFWKLTGTQATVFLFDYGGSGCPAIDFLAISRHNFDGEDIAWQYSTDNFAADTNNAVAGWTQSGNDQIVKVASSPISAKRYWRVTVTSMDNPKCSELFISSGDRFSVLQNPAPVAVDLDNVTWRRSLGGLERSVKHGDRRRSRSYTLLLSSSDLAAFESALDNLDGLSLPFYIRDHNDEYYLARFVDAPEQVYSNKAYTQVSINIIEVI